MSMHTNNNIKSKAACGVWACERLFETKQLPSLYLCLS